MAACGALPRSTLPGLISKDSELPALRRIHNVEYGARIHPAALTQNTSTMKFPRRLIPWLGALAGILGLIWVLRDFDLVQLLKVISEADPAPLLLLPLSIMLEQFIRAVKWRQLLHPLHSVGVWRLFGAIMAGYFANLLAPLGISTFVRGWLIARLENMRFATVLATVVLDRITDGLAFIVFAAFAILSFEIPDGIGNVRNQIAWGAWTNLFIFSMVIGAMFACKYAIRRDFSKFAGFAGFAWISRRLPASLTGKVSGFLRSFLEGAVFPRQAWRQAIIVSASIAIKLVAISYMIWAGLAFDVYIGLMAYVFLMVFLGFIAVLAGSLKIAGGFTIAAVFALEGFGVEVEKALAMAVVVQLSSHLSVAAAGISALWIQGLTLSDLKSRSKAAGQPAPPESP